MENVDPGMLLHIPVEDVGEQPVPTMFEGSPPVPLVERFTTSGVRLTEDDDDWKSCGKSCAIDKRSCASDMTAVTRPLDSPELVMDFPTIPMTARMEIAARISHKAHPPS